MEIDKDKTLKFLSEIQSNVKELKEIREKGNEKFINDYILHNASLRLLQILIEGMISMGSHFLPFPRSLINTIQNLIPD